MKTRSLLLVATLLALLFAFNQPAQAATKHDGHLTMGDVPVGLVDGAGTPGVTSQAFLTACRADLVAGKSTGAIAAFLASPVNGYDGFVIDLGKEKMGAFSVKGPGAKEVIPATPALSAITDYDLDLDFYADPSADPTAKKGTGCVDANERGLATGTKCYAHKPTPDEKTPCVSGYKDSKGKLHGARYVLVNASTELKGPMNITVTTP